MLIWWNGVSIYQTFLISEHWTISSTRHCYSSILAACLSPKCDSSSTNLEQTYTVGCLYTYICCTYQRHAYTFEKHAQLLQECSPKCKCHLRIKQNRGRACYRTRERPGCRETCMHSCNKKPQQHQPRSCLVIFNPLKAMFKRKHSYNHGRLLVLFCQWDRDVANQQPVPGAPVWKCSVPLKIARAEICGHHYRA